MAVVEEFADESAYIKTRNIFGFQGRRDLLLPLSHRKSYNVYITEGTRSGYWTTPEGVQEAAYWESPAGKSVLASIEGPAAMLNSLTELVTRYSDKATVECLKREYGSLRDFFETSSPTTQCNQTIRSVNPQTTECWICGGKITGYPGAGEFKLLELTPECEHVFPIAQALCFAGLYETQLYNQISEREGVDNAEAYRRGVSYEYRWAHRICNQIKNDTHFIVYNDNRFSIDDGMLDSFLRDLQTTNKYGSGKLLMKYVGGKPNDWLVERKAEMNATSDIIINYANTSGLTAEQHSKVTLMSMCSFIATSNVCAGVTEVIPTNSVQTGRVGALGAPVSLTEPVTGSKYFIGLVVTETIGFIDKLVSKQGRAISAVEKANISNMLADKGIVLRALLETKFTVLQLNSIRLKMFYYLKQKYTTGINTNPAWSEFQVSTIQVIFGSIYSVAVNDGLRVIMDGIPAEQVKILTSPALVAGLQGWLQSKLDIIKRAGVEYDRIISMSPAVDPLPTIPTPSWFVLPPLPQSGGGTMVFPETFSLFTKAEDAPHVGIGGLRPRRPLYSNVQVSDSLPLLTDDDSGLRKRSRTRRTRRVRQSTRKSKTRR